VISQLNRYFCLGEPQSRSFSLKPWQASALSLGDFACQWADTVSSRASRLVQHRPWASGSWPSDIHCTSRIAWKKELFQHSAAWSIGQPSSKPQEGLQPSVNSSGGAFGFTLCFVVAALAHGLGLSIPRVFMDPRRRAGTRQSTIQQLV